MVKKENNITLKDVIVLNICFCGIAFGICLILIGVHVEIDHEKVIEEYETTEFEVQKLARLFVPKNEEVTYLCEEGVRIDDVGSVIWFENLGYPEEESKTCMIRTKRGLVKEMREKKHEI